MSANTSKVKPVHVEAMLHNAIARRLRENGIDNAQEIAGKVVLDLTGNTVIEPPEGVPWKFTILGVRLEWPHGLDTRVPDEHEHKALNSALMRTGIKSKTNLLTAQDKVAALRQAYIAMWRRRVLNLSGEFNEEETPVPDHPTAPMVSHDLSSPIKVTQAPPRRAMDEIPTVQVEAPRPRKRAAKHQPNLAAVQKPKKPVITTAMKEHRNTSMHALDDGTIVKAKECPVCIQPVVPQDTVMSTLDKLTADLAAMKS